MSRPELPPTPLPSGSPRWAGPAEEPYLALPKVTLHDHLDGHIHPETLVELAQAQNVSLPYQDGEKLAWWFHTRDAEPREEFPHQKFWFTTALMQDPDSISRVAREWAFDAAADGVIHGEVRWAPEKHVRGGLSMDEAVAAVTAGLAGAETELAASGQEVSFRQLLCGMRETELSAEVAELTVRTYEDGGRGTTPGSVAGFDIAGPEHGHPAAKHLVAAQILHESGVPSTIHAGEGDGVHSLWETVHVLHALRLGHGVRVVEDFTLNGEALDVRTAVQQVELAGGVESADLDFGPVARWILDRQIPLEVCLLSNSRWVVDGPAQHPVDLLAQLGFAVTINPDNRMMSQTCISKEMRVLAETFTWDVADFARAELTAAEAAFLPLKERGRLMERIIEGFEERAPGSTAMG
ncbi:adenosine deaminase family protein [Bogoriella caseilytica]|uniref:adenosine deaminase n=1 Tax=Bogoriella caseilytica TaxID=56055 RepID=A0A3N2BFC0_9MICO|nr:adenosine deaminase family protein [Bogoriella caseilytica]ROR73947.1 adenosine deaminase [Bogoriella caseilytica]